MKFTFTGKRFDISPTLRAYAEKKISKIDRFFKQESLAFVTFSMERGRFIAEVTIENNGMFYRVTESTSDMYASIDSAVAAIERQIRKNKTRLAKRLRDGVIEHEFGTGPAALEDEDSEEEFRIVRNKRFDISPMSTEEAILQMNLLEHSFFVFRNADENDSFSVVYRRKDGDYGIISESEQ